MSSAITSVEIDQGQKVGPQAPTHSAVENNTYPFWAIEYMYTKKNPDQLATSFIHYVTDHMETNDTFIKLGDMSPTILRTHG